MNDFLNFSRVLIVSSKSSHRTSIKKLLLDLGVNNNKIETVVDYTSAKEKLSETIINILILGDDLGDQGTAIDLLKINLEKNPNRFSRLSVFIPGGESDLMEQEFLALGGDLIIQKPFTSATFLKLFKEIIDEKYAFSADEIMTFDVEEALVKNDIEKAMDFYKTFKDPNSPSANYSIGLICLHKNDLNRAYDSFQKSLRDKFDSKVLVKLLDSGVKTKKYKELNKYIEQSIKKMTFSSESAKDVARVVLYNKKFSTLENLKINDDESKIPLAASLVVASSVYLDRGEVQNSIDYALKAIEHSSFKSTIVLKAMEILLLAGGVDKAHKTFADIKLQLTSSSNKELIQSLESLLSVG